jgi:DNA-binding transcriptional MerR regulator
MPRGRTWTIRELADEFGLTFRGLRLYEDRGLLSPRREGHRRFYSPKDRLRLKRIVQAKRLGFTLSEIEELMASGADLRLSPEAIDRQIDYLERRLAEVWNRPLLLEPR